MSVIRRDGAIDVYDLKNHLFAVLGEVTAGREVTVTTHGRPIARINPVVARGGDGQAAAIAAIHALRVRVRRDPHEMSARELIDEGRRR
jgi:prevent-host-death family protein